MTSAESGKASHAQLSGAGASVPSGSRAGPAGTAEAARLAAPAITLPKGGGAIRSIGEKFSTNPATGAASMTIPLASSAGRAGVGPDLSLSYDSGSGNGPFGVGWSLALPAIARKTDKGLPTYREPEPADTFVLASGDDLVPARDAAGVLLVDSASVPGYTVERYRPRAEADFVRIERWTRRADSDVHWRTLSSDNVLNIYGRDAASRIADPADPMRIFSWLLCEMRDDRGQGVVYDYKAEDAVGVDLHSAHESRRGDAAGVLRSANRYLKRVRYGNRVPLLDAAGRRPLEIAPAALAGAGWMFELVFDYGEHSAADPRPDDNGPWLCRHDPFSTCRPGFELRSYRLCQRTLMFHHFPNRPGIGQSCLVRSTNFSYRSNRGVAADVSRGHPVASFIATVTQTGYRRVEGGGGGGVEYTSQSMPPLAFEYSQATISTEVRTLDDASRAHLPAGVDGSRYRWVDFDGEGLAGVLTEQGGAWHYKRNLGQGRLGPLETVAPLPSMSALSGGAQQLMDLDGNGRLDLVHLGRDCPGFFQRTAAGGWDNFASLPELPNINWNSANLRLIDLTGDGLADLFITEDEAFTWHQALGRAGFGTVHRVSQALDEERGARLILADGTETIFLADMSGDGLTDLVRIRNGSICYWPNLGYGRFGAKVEMDHAPLFEEPDLFDPTRIRLADIDGTGVTDLLYIGARAISLWFNQAGNGWGAAHMLPALPHLNKHTALEVTDLLGTGTACLVWSSALAGDEHAPLRYIDLVGPLKPHLLVSSSNNQGLETRITYAPSTRFYVADREAGTPWITRLPFAVQVVERVERIDRISGTRALTRYSYHHGYFDGEEREFRGFGMVEQHDSEAFEDYVAGVQAIGGSQELARELYQPPVTSRTWFHSGAAGEDGRRLHQMRAEYYLGQQHTPEPLLPAGMDPVELRECARALAGVVLRHEVYSADGSPVAGVPYRVIEHNYEVRQLQRRTSTAHAVFFVYGCETLTHDYERDAADPRVSHSSAARRCCWAALFW